MTSLHTRTTIAYTNNNIVRCTWIRCAYAYEPRRRKMITLVFVVRAYRYVAQPVLKRMITTTEFMNVKYYDTYVPIIAFRLSEPGMINCSPYYHDDVVIFL